MATRIPRRFDDLVDVDMSTVADGDVPTYDAGTETWIPGTGGGAGTDDQTAAEVPFTPAGGLAATNVQTALEELDTEKAAASHVHDGGDITTGTVADARIASTIARDTEVTAAISAHEAAGDPHPGYLTAAEGDAAYQPLGSYQPLDSDLTAIAALSTTAFGRGLLELANAAALLAAAGAQASDSDLTAIAGLSPSNDDVIQRKAGAWTNRTMAQLISDLAALGTTFQPLDADLTALAALTTNAAGRGILTLADPNADRIAFWDDSAGAMDWLTAGTGLTITGTTISSSSSVAADDESLVLHVNLLAV